MTCDYLNEFNPENRPAVLRAFANDCVAEMDYESGYTKCEKIILKIMREEQKDIAYVMLDGDILPMSIEELGAIYPKAIHNIYLATNDSHYQ